MNICSVDREAVARLRVDLSPAQGLGSKPSRRIQIATMRTRSAGAAVSVGWLGRNCLPSGGNSYLALHERSLRILRGAAWNH